MGPRFDVLDRDRGVSTVIGFILIFAMLIVLLSMYQALWVPIQNEQVEYDHYQSVSDDMTDLRSAIFEARTTGEPQSTTITLGTRYPNRLLAVNPPPATGRLETGERRNISIRSQGGGPIDIPATFPGIGSWGEVYTQFVSYTPEYRVLDTGAPIRHEHGLLYKDFAETGQGGGLVVQNDGQTLVRSVEDGPDRLTLIPIQGNLSERGTGRVSIDPEPGILVTREFEDTNVTVPTDLGESTWETVLSEHLPPENVLVDETAGELTLVLDGTWRIQYAPVGVDGPPASGERGAAGSDINPASPGDVRLVSVDRRQNANEWVITWENTGGTVNISEARVNFYPGAAETVLSVSDPLNTRSVNWDVGGDFQVLDPPVQLTGADQLTDVTVGFDSVLGSDEWWILTVIFETGEQGMYFISEGGTAAGGGTSEAPTVSIDGTSVTSQGNNNDVSLTFTGADANGNLDAYTVTLYTDSNQGTVIDSQTDGAYTGGTTTVTLNGINSNQYPSPYWIVVEVIDTTGLTDSAGTQVGV